MKLLHTSDWHLNDRLGGIDRTQHLRQRVEKVAQICDEQKVDVLIIAGDLFSEQAEVSARVNQVADSLRHIRQTFTPFFARGGIVLAVTGNHDQDGRVRPYLTLARAGMDIAEAPKNRGEYFSRGRMYLLDTAFVGRVRDNLEGFDTQFALLPFPNLNRVLTGRETASTAAELNRPVGEHVANWIRSLPEMPGYDVNLRTVLVAHLYVTGADVGRGMFRVNESSNVLLDAAALPIGFDYIALGHIHKPQRLRDQDHIRYSGSLDRMDHGDDDPTKEIVLVDIGPNGRRSVEVITIAPTQLITATISTPESAAEELAAQVPDPASALVRVIVEPAAASAGAAIEIAIRNSLTVVTTVEWRPPETRGNQQDPFEVRGNTVRERVHNYLTDRIPANDSERDALLELAAKFLDREGHR